MEIYGRPLARLLSNYSDQKTCQMADRPPELVVEHLSDGVGGNLRRQTSEQASESFRAMALQGEEVFKLIYDAFDELPLAGCPPAIFLWPRSPPRGAPCRRPSRTAPKKRGG